MRYYRKSPCMTQRIAVSLVLLLLIVQACKHRPLIDTPTPPGDGACDPDSVYFELQILPILVSRCAMAGCHAQINSADGVNLTSYSRVMQTADIKPGKLDGDFWEAITETKADKRMPPPPLLPLSAAEIALIRTWLLQGAQNLQCDPNIGGCQTDNMSFAQDIQPILQTACTGCHGGANPQGGIQLSNFSGVSQVLSQNRLLGAIKKQPGYTAMPPAGPGLPDCQISKIEAWINQGAKNN